MDNVLSTWGPRIFDPDAMTKIFIENATAKALDPSRWSGKSRLIRIRHMLLDAWKSLGITSVLHSNDVLKQAIDFFQTTDTPGASHLDIDKNTEAKVTEAKVNGISDSPANSNIDITQSATESNINSTQSATESNINSTQSASEDLFQKISAVELLFGIVKDTAIDTWKNEDKAILGKCLEYTVYYRDNVISSNMDLDVGIFKSKTLYWLNNGNYFSGWDVIMRVVLPLLAARKTELKDPFFAELVEMSRHADVDWMQSPAKYALESQTLLRPYIPKLEQMMTSDPKAKNLLNNIRNVLDYGVCIDNDELMDSTLNRVLQNLRFKVGGKGLFISASNTLFSHKNILAMSTATVAEYACANSRVLPGPVKWVGYAMYPHLFLMTRKALVGVENLFTRKTQAAVASAV